MASEFEVTVTLSIYAGDQGEAVSEVLKRLGGGTADPKALYVIETNAKRKGRK